MEKGLASWCVPRPIRQEIGFNILGRFHYGPWVGVVTLSAWMRRRLTSEDEYLNVLADRFNQKCVERAIRDSSAGRPPLSCRQCACRCTASKKNGFSSVGNDESIALRN
jgi:hypothetical protein